MTGVFLVALFFHVDLAPLEETYWDAPRYVQLSKRAAETHLLAGYRQHAREIQPGPDRGIYWNFTRIGHILILGEVTRLFGASEAALHAMQWLYRFFMALGVTLCVAIGLRLNALFRSGKPDSIWWAGYAISALTYVASDSYRGLQGHLISEPPVFATLALFALAFVRAVERRSMALAALAGGLLFIVFFIRIDAVLPGIIFLAVLTATLEVSGRTDARPSLLMASLVFLASYAVYAWSFFPLADPNTLAEFARIARENTPGLAFQSLIKIVIAGGMLWIGACAALANWRDPVVRFAAAWLVFALFPMLVGIILQGGNVLVRSAFFVALPLLVLGGEGWCRILRSAIDQKDGRPLVAAVGLLAVLALTPYAPVKQTLRELAISHLSIETNKHLFPTASEPGGIRPMPSDADPRLGLLVRPIQERQTYDYAQARELSAYLYRPQRPAYLVRPERDLTGDDKPDWEFVILLRYFGEEYGHNTDILSKDLSRKGKDTAPCTASLPHALEPIIFCQALSQSERDKLLSKQIPLYVLTVAGYPTPDIQLDQMELRISRPPYTLHEAVAH